MRRFNLLVLLCLPLGLAAEGLPGAEDLGGALMGLGERFTAALDAAALKPEPMALLGVVALMGVLPFGLAPMSLLCLLAALAFPPSVAAPVIMAGLLLNTVLSWSIARTVIGSKLEAWLESRGGALAAVRRGARNNGLKWAILSRYVPAPFFTQPMVLASTGVGLGTTLLGTAIGMSPWIGVYVWVAKAGRQGSLKSLGLAGAGLALAYALAAWIRWRYTRPAAIAALEALRPRSGAGPCLKLYTVPGHEPSDEARTELAALRERLGFEVDETVMDEQADPALRAAYEDHAPVAVFEGEKLFNFKMDENVLRVRLEAWRRRQEAP
jgi:uncharacterized membrane protein YdjX (TVP38/TMEM64 family)